MQNLASSMLYYIQWYIGIKRSPKWPFHWVFDATILRSFRCFFSSSRDRKVWLATSSLCPESPVKRDCFKLPPNSRGLKTARLWPRISSTPNETFNFSKLWLNSVNFEVFDSINQFLIFHHFLFYNKSLNRPLKRSLWAGPRGWAGQDFN